jgi:hypothetical protein
MSNPTTQAGRLEQVREAVGAGNIRDFWKLLMERAPGGYSISYEAVRNYHAGREAPVSYLVRVADAFGFRLEWLASGSGPRTQAEFNAAARALAGRQRDQASAFVQDVCDRYGIVREAPDYLPWWAPLAAGLEVRYALDREKIISALDAVLVACGGMRMDDESLGFFMGTMLPAFMAVAHQREGQMKQDQQGGDDGEA